MDSAHPTASWEQVGERFYRKISLYTEVFDRDVDLDNYIVVGAPYGGAVALFRDDTKLQAFRPGKSSKPSIDIHSCAGALIRRIPWDKGPIKGLGWAHDEKLIVVTQDGTVRCYYDLQGDFNQFLLGNGAEDFGVTSCKFYHTGMVALLSNNALVSVTSYDEPRPKLLAQPPEGKVHSWAVVPPSATLSRSVEVLLSIGQTIYVSDATECEDRFLDIGPFTHLSLSPNGRFAALYTATGHAHVITSDFQTRLSEFDSRSRTPPKAVEWCGNDAIVVAWEDEVNVVGPGSEVARYYYDGRVHVIPDCDGVRLISNDVCDFVQKVPDVTEEVFRFGTQSPASILLDAVQQLELKSPKADDNIQLIKANLVEAVDSCVNAAGHEFSVHWQKELLRAASFGKSVLDIYNSDDFVDMCETLRVLNAVRFFRVGLPLSLEQYARLGADGVLSRLLNRHLYALALQVAAYLRLPTHAILTHWARAKVRLGTEDDDEVCRLIVDKLGGRPGISFESVARSAFDEGRIRLATQLLEHEPRAGRQVPLLLGMSGGASESHASPGRQEEPDPSAGATATDEAALDKALDSGDTDLVLYVLHTLRHRLSLAAFLRIASSRPGAAALVEAAPHIFDSDYTSDSGAPPTGGTLLKDLYYADDRRADGARVLIREGLHMPGPRTAADKLALAARLLADAKDGSAAASAAPDMQALREATALLRVQEALARDLGDGSASVPNAPVTAPAGGSDDAATAADEAAGGGADNDSRGWVGLSVTETIFRLVRLGYYGRAKKLVAEFRVPERVFAWVRLRALVAKRDWREIEELSRASKKSPIGWEPYFTLVLQAGNPRLASTFVPKCQASPGPNGRGPRLEPGEAVRMYERCGMRVKAAEEAVKEKDMDAWTRLLEAAGRGTAEGREIERLGRDVFAKKK